MTQSFLSVHWAKNWESFWPKNSGQIFVLPVIEFFLGQNDSFFLSVHEAKTLSHFDSKIWVKF